MMRVDLVARPGGGRSGVGRYATALCAALNELGVDVRLAPTVTGALPATLTRLAGRRNLDVRAFLASYPVVVSTRPGAVVHVTAQTFATMLWLRPGGVVTVHDLFAADGAAGRRRAAAALLDAASRLALHRAEALLTGSTVTAGLIGARGVAPRYGIVPTSYGVDHAVFRRMAVPDGFRRSLGLGEAVPVLLYVGTEAPRKRVDFLLRLLSRLRGNGWPTAILVKVGAPTDPVRRDELRKLSQDLGLTRAVLWLDGVAEEQLAWLYNMATVYVSSADREGFGLPVLEALACGTPVAVSDIAAHREVVGAAGRLLRSGDLEAWADGISELLRRRDLAADYGRRGVERAAQFTWRRVAKKTLRVYERLGRPVR